MKRREGFVSNSSSSSFIVRKGDVSEQQLDMILNPEKYINTSVKEKYIQLLDEDETFDQELFESWCQNKFGWVEDAGGWNIRISNENTLELFTIMDNFQYGEYAEVLGIPHECFSD